MLRTHAERTVLRLQIARTLRGFSQGIAVVDMALYLKDLHWSAEAIGGVLSLAGIVGAALILIVGVTSDRFGRKPFLVVYETVTALAALLMILTTNPVVLTIVIVLTSFGRGQNGSAGPFMPAEQAWMAACVPLAERGRVFSINNALAFFGLAVGSLLAGANHLWIGRLPGAASFHPLFFLIFLASIVCVVTVGTAPSERGLSEKHRNAVPLPSEEKAVRRRENKNIAKLASVNVLNGLAIGFVAPMMSYWFATKFGVSSAEIGVTMALSFVLTGGSSLITGALTKRFGMVKPVVVFRILGMIMLLIVPLMPSFWLASTFYIVRSAFSRGSQGARSALSSSLTRDQRRGFSVSMNSLVVRLASTVGPACSGYLLEMDMFSIPFFIAGALQFVSALLYGRLFRDFNLPQETSYSLDA